MPIGRFSKTPDSNGTADAASGINLEEGWPAATMNNVIRSIMAEMAKDSEDRNGISSTSSVTDDVTTYEVTLNSSVISFSELRGFVFIPDANNEGAALINITGQGKDALGAKNIKHSNGSNVGSGDLIDGAMVYLIYNGSHFVIMSSSSGQIYNPNLLDNPLGYDGNIDQRGIGTGSVALNSFPLDRWKSVLSSGGTAIITADGTFSFNRQLRQSIDGHENIQGKTVTVSAEYADVDIEIHIGSATIITLPAGANTSVTATWQNGGASPEYFEIRAASGSGNRWAVKGLKLEAGNVSSSFQIPQRLIEFVKCQRHLQIYGNSTNHFALGAGVWKSSVNLHAPILFNPEMAATPTIEISSNNGFLNEITNNNSTSVSSAVHDLSPQGVVMNVQCETGLGGVNNAGILYVKVNETLGFSTGL